MHTPHTFYFPSKQSCEQIILLLKINNRGLYLTSVKFGVDPSKLTDGTNLGPFVWMGLRRVELHWMQRLASHTEPARVLMWFKYDILGKACGLAAAKERNKSMQAFILSPLVSSPVSEPQPGCMAGCPPPEEQFFRCRPSSCAWGNKWSQKKWNLHWTPGGKLPAATGSILFTHTYSDVVVVFHFLCKQRNGQFSTYPRGSYKSANWNKMSTSMGVTWPNFWAARTNSSAVEIGGGGRERGKYRRGN